MKGRRVLAVAGVAGLAAVALVIAFIAGRGGEAQPFVYGYPAKFLCGTYTLPWDPTVTVEMRTAINVHNPTTDMVHIEKKAVQALTEDEPLGRIGTFQPFDIPPDGAFEIDCADIMTLLGLPIQPPFVKGFVVIHSPVELDVVGVYNAQRVVDGATPGVGHAIDVDTIEVRPLPPAPVPSQYAAKFVCGTADAMAPLAPGDYFTDVNVHNPDEVNPVILQKKVVLAKFEYEPPEPPTGWTLVNLGPDGAFEVDCPDINMLLGALAPVEDPWSITAGPCNDGIDNGPDGLTDLADPDCFIKGFVVLSSPAELDVVGVYGTTEEMPIAPDGGVGAKIDLEPVKPQRPGALP